MEKSKDLRYLINVDILSIFEFGKTIEWITVRENSIYRILYLSSVFYSFRFSDNENPFSIYNFSVNINGPFDSNISTSINFLLKDDYIARANGDDVFKLGTNEINDSFTADLSSERKEWIKQIIYILGIYGENKIYEFIFRDPEYQNNLKSNTQQGLNIGEDNKSINTLKEFEKAFRQSLGVEVNNLLPQRYLELYFEYVFGKILKREQ
ncbi:hypothetical protein P2W68_01460 [Chryseobacterium arthrosphaerae]|uniref:hypothetical protein n=1 Tax=Chryseobacterium arthrosphaerae TaxID=651561 RepID=UPI0023E1F946|nr:hypothetical protein [Chryseobacterium arthrosphaerae]WES98292.1 hypothetical protein P2W68_01460 [Chryseobacterium arthrosphaerae]